jgi:hypothetical protein
MLELFEEQREQFEARHHCSSRIAAFLAVSTYERDRPARGSRSRPAASPMPSRRRASVPQKSLAGFRQRGREVKCGAVETPRHQLTGGKRSANYASLWSRQR